MTIQEDSIRMKKEFVGYQMNEIMMRVTGPTEYLGDHEERDGKKNEGRAKGRSQHG